jgi:hypothetical protein
MGQKEIKMFRDLTDEQRAELERIRYEEYLESQNFIEEEVLDEDSLGFYSKEERDAEIWHTQYAEFDY